MITYGVKTKATDQIPTNNVASSTTATFELGQVHFIRTLHFGSKTDTDSNKSLQGF